VNGLPGWDDEQMQAAMERIREVAGILALPEEQATTRLAELGRYPVSVSHGAPEDAVAAALIERLARTARRYRCVHKTGKSEATTYLFSSPQAAAGFLAGALGFAESWWILTFTAKPVYPGGTGLTGAVSDAAARKLAADLDRAESDGAADRIADEAAADRGPVPDQDYGQLRTRAAAHVGNHELLIAALIRGYRKQAGEGQASSG
jgi:hypothetical protein